MAHTRRGFVVGMATTFGVGAVNVGVRLSDLDPSMGGR